MTRCFDFANYCVQHSLLQYFTTLPHCHQTSIYWKFYRVNSSSLLISLPFPSFRRFTKTRRGLRFGDVRSASIFQECEQANRQRSHLPRVCSREGVRRRRRVCHYFPWTCIPVSFWYLIFMQLWINRWFMQQGKDVALFSHLYHDLYSFPVTL